MRGVLKIALSCLGGLLLTGSLLAQTAPVEKRPGMPKQIAGGVLNGKATYLPKPNYPASAKAVGASGAVSVQVLIDEQGYVASASAISGHPLLREAAVEAASSARFSPTMLNGVPVRVSGMITYNFVTDLSPLGLGYELSYAERTGAFGKNVYPESLASLLPAGWEAERKTLNSIGKPQNVESPADPVSAGDLSKGSSSSPDAMYAQRKLSPEDVTAVRRLQEDVGAKLRTDQNKQWAFKAGRTLGKLVAEIDQDYQFRANVAELEQIAAAAPPSIPEVELKRLKAFIDKSKSVGTSTEERKALVDGAMSLRSMKVS